MTSISTHRGCVMEEVWRRYALALALVPEPNVAGDLFAAAHDEVDLRRRAAAWRRAAGLPPAPERPALPALDEVQRAHALHLWRQVQRRGRKGRLVAAGAALLLVLLVGAQALRSGRRALAADPAFAGTPVAVAQGTDGLRLSVYRTAATPAQVSVWWALDGPGAGRLAGGPGPHLLHPLRENAWLTAASHEQVAVRRDRLVGRSSYSVLQLGWSNAKLRLDTGGGALQVSSPLQHALSPGARTLNLGRPVPGEGGQPSAGRLERVTIAPDYVGLASTFAGPLDGRLVQYVLEPEGPHAGATQRLTEVAAAVSSDARTRIALFPPLPNGTTALTVRYAVAYPQEVTYPAASPAVVGWHREGNTFVADLSLPADTIFLGQDAFTDFYGPADFRDAAGHLYYTQDAVRLPPDRQETLYRRVRFVALDVPPDFVPTTITFHQGRLQPGPAVRIDLRAGN